MTVENKNRFIIPIIFSILGIVITFFIVHDLSATISSRFPFDLVPRIAGGIVQDVQFLLYLFLPIYFVVYLILTIPMALLMIVFNKISRATTYEIGIYTTGQGFNTTRMIRRAIVPSLFALSSAEIFLNLLPDWFFRTPDAATMTSGDFLRIFDPLQTIVGALLALIVGIFIFAPTWTLNDSGIVTQVKSRLMESRLCPDTEGVGRWFSNLFGGFAILAYPVTTFHRYFYLRYVVFGVELNNQNIANGIFWVIGIPFLIMSFILPFIILHELGLGRITPMIQRFAKKVGAKDVKPKSLMLEMLEVKDQLNEQTDEVEYDSDSTRLTRK